MYKSLPSHIFGGFLPPEAAEPAVQVLEYSRDSGYCGPKTQENVDWIVQQVPRDSLNTCEDFLKKDPITLEQLGTWMKKDQR